MIKLNPQCKDIQLKLYRAIIFGPATAFIFFKGHYYPDSFYEKWQPISFYQLFDSTFTSTSLTTLKWAWFILALTCFVTSFKATRYFQTLAKLASLMGVTYLGHDYNFGVVYHGTHLYIGVALILAFAPLNHSTNPEFSGARWHLELIKFFITFMLFGAGLQKLLKGGLSWVFSDSLYIKMALLPSHTWAAEILLSSPLWVFQLFAFMILFGVQLSAPLALTNRYIGMIYFLLWSFFHLGATYFFSIGSTFYLQIFCYTIFLPLYGMAYRERK